MLDARQLVSGPQERLAQCCGQSLPKHALALLHAGLHALRHSSACVLGLPESAAKTFVVWFLKGIPPSTAGGNPVLVVYAGQRPQGSGILRTPGDKSLSTKKL